MLKTVYRQSQKVFADFLTEVRVGGLSAGARRFLEGIKRVNQDELETVDAVKLFTVHDSVDQYNNQAYASLSGQGLIYTAYDWSHGTFSVGERSIHFPKQLSLKRGSRVMFRMNTQVRVGDGTIRRLVNGHMGTVVDFEDLFPVVKFDHTEAGVLDVIQFHKYEIKGERDRVLFSRIQLPLILAHGITIHKSQGLSLDHVAIDFQRTFAFGHAYVALSRCRSVDGLFLCNFSEDKIKADSRVIQFYSAFRETDSSQQINR